MEDHVPLPILNHHEDESSSSNKPLRRSRRIRQKLLKAPLSPNKRQKLCSTNTNTNTNSAPPKPSIVPPPKPQIVAPPKPPPPKAPGPSRHETIYNLDPQILAALGGSNSEFMKAVFGIGNGGEIIVDGNGGKFEMNKKVLMDNIKQQIVLSQDEDEDEEDMDMAAVDHKENGGDKKEDEVEDMKEWMKIKDALGEVLDTKGKHWKKKTGEIDRLVYAIWKAIQDEIPGPLSGAWWQVVQKTMNTTSNYTDIKSYFDKTVAKKHGGYGYSQLANFNAMLKKERSKAGASRS